MATMLPSEADAAVRNLTHDELCVKADDRSVYLVREADDAKVHLLPYQLTPEGLAHAIIDSQLWPAKPATASL
jgi:hypothetical protein